MILLAVSRDGLRWTKQPEFRFSPEGNPHYRYPGSCRDPFLFWNPERKEYGMLFCATPARLNGDAAGYAGMPTSRTGVWTNPLRYRDALSATNVPTFFA